MAHDDPDRALDGLNPEQLEAVTVEARHLCILAGAGSGKTRVLTRRIAHRVAIGDIDPRQVLALTFTRRAASELTGRLRTLGLRDSVAAGTFHAIALAQLRTRWAERDVRPPELLDRKVGFVARLLPRRDQRAQPLDVVAEIEWAKARTIEPTGYAAAVAAAKRTPPLDARIIADVFDRYEAEKHRRRLVDFDDLLRLWTRELTRDPAFAEAQRWRFRHLFVDEYQDLNPLQHALLEAWLGDRSDLCAVGDPNQAIYGWNGADADYIRRFAHWYPGATVVSLRRNHRSTPQILAVADAVLRADDPSAEAFEPTRPDGPAPTVAAHDSDIAEADAIARLVRDARRPGGRWAEQAVLTRTNAQLAVIEEALRRAKIPYRTRGGSGLLDQPDIKRLIDRMRRTPTPLTALVTDLQVQLGEGEPDEAAGTDDDPDADGAAAIEERRANLAALLQLAQDHLALDPDADSARFAGWLLSTRGRDDHDRPADAVELATFHAAKGLEWPIVHLAGLEQGLVPIGYAKTPEALAEEARLLYVALTRAEQRVTLHWARERRFGTRTSTRYPSPYLGSVELALTSLKTGRSIDELRHLESARQALGDSGGTRRRRRRSAPASDDPVLEALRQWRRDAARAADVPAFVIFHDATLEAVASARPSSSSALRSVPGIGPVKLARYGDDLLDIVARHA